MKLMNTIANVINEIVAKSENSTDLLTGYKKNGIIYCSKCHTPKQTRIHILSNTRIVPCLCRCENEKYQRQKEAQIKANQEIEIRRLRLDGIEDKQICNFSFDNAEKTIEILRCQKYIENWERLFHSNIGLLLWGKPDSGKTFAAGCIANALIDKRIPVLVTSFPKILNSKYDKSTFFNDLKKYDMLVLDDLGTERTSEYALEIVFAVIDERIKINKPMIITTNLQYSEMKNPKSIEYSRIYSRILGCCVPIYFNGTSRREIEGEHKKNIIKEIFK